MVNLPWFILGLAHFRISRVCYIPISAVSWSMGLAQLVACLACRKPLVRSHALCKRVRHLGFWAPELKAFLLMHNRDLTH